ncbi:MULTISPECIES: methionine aminotransferase [Flavobacterium]|uniref:Aminotransferase class I/II-fold pyridoxal phosphate-dependent enzyme n=2 Tax=Flavobacterium TaxID=237 RepID=A0A2N9PAJ4_9FLAO|nr:MULTISPECIES: methionine aminotransferase [Flavobacterium]QYS88586.1 aminotransferase class I/II-fold pyridoxal phosphate-dependent enzyme [Flavobacterium davisii]RVU92029.1 aminotransferase class I/II-fold pyridoxal phosphate-dependent enzyme [Flavobacterium columnare]SPE77331.1 Methionine aminotransferase [Flavobacterium columnare]
MSKLPHITTSIFTTMSKLANEKNAINLSQGFPNFPEDKRLIDISQRILKDNIHQYTPMAGLPTLMEKIAKQTQAQYNRSVDFNIEMLITAGATQGIYSTINALISTNDEVIILDPCYDSYEPSVLIAGGKPIRVPLNPDYTPDFNNIEKAISSKTKMIIINNPHNPTGRIWDEKDFESLEIILEKHPQILILGDEVYEYITFKQAHISFNTRKKLIHRTIIASSFGKSLHVTGWKIGYLIAPELIMNEIKKVHQFLVFSVNSFAQFAIAEYLDIVNFDAVSKMYLQKRNLFQALLKNSPFELMPCDGTYFQVVNYQNISKENDVLFAKELIEKQGVAAIPMSVFYNDLTDRQMLRFCFAKTDETLIQAAEKLIKIK